MHTFYVTGSDKIDLITHPSLIFHTIKKVYKCMVYLILQWFAFSGCYFKNSGKWSETLIVYGLGETEDGHVQL